ncbi:hypothetical protein SAMN02745121_05052 [Nannocystis exedens]|uniref:Uncharacterized protein n=1 Tax=Nannocystis exedens TaxID=54 RepID=A0A1I2CCC6_9BACT|nr:hypothetical protein [Nannocystis exedens]PCC68382.1 Tetratricopeptide repeat protein [Nannocystis exedens]SFE65904.1 hypothetical protein SAMN02745121_05052 [Nannocystis exedens]
MTRPRTIADRFEVVASGRSLKSLRWEASRRHRPYGEDDLWTLAVDRRTGARVRVLEPPDESVWLWAACMWTEAVARHVVAAASPHTVPILHVGPGVVFAEPPPAVARPRLPPAQAAACAFAACEVVARLHAVGCGGECGRSAHGRLAFDMPTPIDFGPHNLRMTRRTGDWTIAWLVPSHLALADLDLAPPETDPDALARDLQARLAGSITDESPDDLPPKYDPQSDPIARDLARLAGFYLSLAPPERGRPAAVDAVRRLAAGEPVVRDVAGLARLFAELGPASDRDARLAALPVVDVLPPPVLDWDRVIAAGEARLPGLVPRQRPYVVLPLAVAYHHRASLRAALAPEDALRDVDRAVELDPIAPYHITRAVLLDRLGRRDEARAAIAAAFAAPEWSDPPVEEVGGIRLVRAHPVVITDRERARAHATRGTIALRDGDLALAEHDLRRAVDLDLTAAHLHALGAALYARGDLAGAAAAEARAVELEPASARYRWDLVVSLHRLGRRDEALFHARKLEAMEAGDPSGRARRIRLPGGA